MKISIEIDRCIGGGQCVNAAPEVFDQDEDGLVLVLDDDPPTSIAPDVHLAANLCPARVIDVTDQ